MSQTMPPTPLPKPPPLTLIVATTPTHGIGHRGTLPWPALKTDLAFFARVTKRAVPVPGEGGKDSEREEGGADDGSKSRGKATEKKKKNAVVMGRKTWDSIPPRYRPLRGRINVVVTRDVRGLREKMGLAHVGGVEVEGGEEIRRESPVVVVGSIMDGLRRLQQALGRDRDSLATASGISNVPPSSSSSSSPPEKNKNGTIPNLPNADQDPKIQEADDEVELGRVFIIGGAEIYAAALKLPDLCTRVLWTRMEREWECDVWFPGGGGGGGGGLSGSGSLMSGRDGDDGGGVGEGEGKGGHGDGMGMVEEDAGGWERKSTKELEEWVGEVGVGGRKEEGGVGFEVLMLERRGG